MLAAGVHGRRTGTSLVGLISSRHFFLVDYTGLKIINIVWFRCVFLGAKYAKNAFAAGAPPRTPLGELAVLPRFPSWISGAYL